MWSCSAQISRSGEEEQAPSEWREGHFIKLSKEGDLSSSSNYRGITLLFFRGKVFILVLLGRVPLVGLVVSLRGSPYPQQGVQKQDCSQLLRSGALE